MELCHRRGGGPTRGVVPLVAGPADRHFAADAVDARRGRDVRGLAGWAEPGPARDRAGAGRDRRGRRHAGQSDEPVGTAMAVRAAGAVDHPAVCGDARPAPPGVAEGAGLFAERAPVSAPGRDHGGGDLGDRPGRDDRLCQPADGGDPRGIPGLARRPADDRFPRRSPRRPPELARRDRGSAGLARDPTARRRGGRRPRDPGRDRDGAADRAGRDPRCRRRRGRPTSRGAGKFRRPAPDGHRRHAAEARRARPPREGVAAPQLLRILGHGHGRHRADRRRRPVDLGQCADRSVLRARTARGKG